MANFLPVMSPRPGGMTMIVKRKVIKTLISSIKCFTSGFVYLTSTRCIWFISQTGGIVSFFTEVTSPLFLLARRERVHLPVRIDSALRRFYDYTRVDSLSSITTFTGASLRLVLFGDFFLRTSRIPMTASARVRGSETSGFGRITAGISIPISERSHILTQPSNFVPTFTRSTSMPSLRKYSNMRFRK